MTLRLIALDCPACGSAMQGEGRDVIFFCSHCGSGALLEADGLDVIEASALLPAAGRHARIWRPAWRIDTEVTVADRRRAGGRETEGWQGERVFVVPAFELPLTDLVLLARALSEVAATAGEVPREPIRGGVLSVADALTVARHLVIGDEIRKPDMLESVDVDIRERSHRLLATPFEEGGDGRLRCAVTGVVVRPRAD